MISEHLYGIIIFHIIYESKIYFAVSELLLIAYYSTWDPRFTFNIASANESTMKTVPSSSYEVKVTFLQ